MCLRISVNDNSQLNVKNRSLQSLPELPLDSETMHVMKVIWLLLAACPCMLRGRADAYRRNIPAELLDLFKDDDGFNTRNMFLSRPRSTNRMSILRSLLQEEAANDDLFDGSYHSRRWNQLRMSKRTRPQAPQDCCPVVKERITPLGGISRQETVLELYRATNKIQTFYQTKCQSDFVDRPCRFIAQPYTSKCVQRWTFMYALVKSHNVSEPYRMDYIKVKSGCKCQIQRQKV